MPHSVQTSALTRRALRTSPIAPVEAFLKPAPTMSTVSALLPSFVGQRIELDAVPRVTDEPLSRNSAFLFEFVKRRVQGPAPTRSASSMQEKLRSQEWGAAALLLVGHSIDPAREVAHECFLLENITQLEYLRHK
jgi:hypothetical protein